MVAYHNTHGSSIPTLHAHIHTRSHTHTHTHTQCSTPQFQKLDTL